MKKSEGAVVYEFLVSRKHLAKSKLLLEETDFVERGVPEGETYWFYLQDFAPGRQDEKKPALPKSEVNKRFKKGTGPLEFKGPVPVLR